MFKRLFLAGTIVFPLYLIFFIQQVPPLSNGVASYREKPERILKKLDKTLEELKKDSNAFESEGWLEHP